MEKIGKGVFDGIGGVFKVNIGEFLDKFGDVVGSAGDGGVR